MDGCDTRLPAEEGPTGTKQKNTSTCRVLYSTQIENNITDRDGNVVKRQFIHYGAPTSLILAQLIGKSLQMINRSWRIVTNDGAPDRGGVINVVEKWYREGWQPDEEKTGE